MLAQQPTFRGAFTKSTVSIAKYILTLKRQVAIYDKLDFTYLYYGIHFVKVATQLLLGRDGVNNA
jgi:hypothetical protein